MEELNNNEEILELIEESKDVKVNIKRIEEELEAVSVEYKKNEEEKKTLNQNSDYYKLRDQDANEYREQLKEKNNKIEELKSNMESKIQGQRNKIEAEIEENSKKILELKEESKEIKNRHSDAYIENLKQMVERDRQNGISENDAIQQNRLRLINRESTIEAEILECRENIERNRNILTLLNYDEIEKLQIDDQNKDDQNKDDQNKDDQNKDDKDKDGQNKDDKNKDDQNKDDKDKDGQNKDDKDKDGQNKDDKDKDGQNKDGQNKDGQNKDGQNKGGQNKGGQNKGGQNEGGQNKDDKKISYIEINANTGKVIVTFDDQTVKDDYSIESLLKQKENILFANGIEEKKSIMKKINPIVIAVLDDHNEKDMLNAYIDNIKGLTYSEMPNIVYDLKDSQLPRKENRMLKKFSKNEKEFDNVIVEKDSFWNKIKKRFFNKNKTIGDGKKQADKTTKTIDDKIERIDPEKVEVIPPDRSNMQNKGEMHFKEELKKGSPTQEEQAENTKEFQEKNSQGEKREKREKRER